jgi:hypothetical protein
MMSLVTTTRRMIMPTSIVLGFVVFITARWFLIITILFIPIYIFTIPTTYPDLLFTLLGWMITGLTAVGAAGIVGTVGTSGVVLMLTALGVGMQALILGAGEWDITAPGVIPGTILVW